MSLSGWRGVDLDGTLAYYKEWNEGKIGHPIPAMLARVKAWLENGETVKIFTARVGVPGEECDHERKKIQAWCIEHIGQSLEVTATKDFAMVELWDDRAVQVVPNTGQRIDDNPKRDAIEACRQILGVIESLILELKQEVDDAEQTISGTEPGENKT